MSHPQAYYSVTLTKLAVLQIIIPEISGFFGISITSFQCPLITLSSVKLHILRAIIHNQFEMISFLPDLSNY